MVKFDTTLKVIKLLHTESLPHLNKWEYVGSFQTLGAISKHGPEPHSARGLGADSWSHQHPLGNSRFHRGQHPCTPPAPRCLTAGVTLLTGLQCRGLCFQITFLPHPSKCQFIWSGYDLSKPHLSFLEKWTSCLQLSPEPVKKIWLSMSPGVLASELVFEAASLWPCTWGMPQTPLASSWTSSLQS